MHDPPYRVSALQPERQAPVAIRVEVKAEPLQVVHALGRLADKHLGSRAAHRSAPSPLGVAQVQLEAVVGREHCREPALRPVAGGLGERHRRQQRDGGTLVGRAQRRIQPSRTGSNHRDIDIAVSCARRGGRTHPASFTSAAASTPSDSTTTSSKATTSAFHFGCAARRVRAAAPQCRHQFWSGLNGAWQSGQRSRGKASAWATAGA